MDANQLSVLRYWAYLSLVVLAWNVTKNRAPLKRDMVQAQLLVLHMYAYRLNKSEPII